MKFDKPWGFYETLVDLPKYKVKHLVVYNGQQISLQLHHSRSEYWIVVKGSGTVQIGNQQLPANVGDSFLIPVNAKHRLTASDSEDIEIIEVQLGVLGPCQEEDIVRFEDKYGR
jgi:mannose-6-phosphate isomerase-like protein (cupin superfamily)